MASTPALLLLLCGFSPSWAFLTSLLSQLGTHKTLQSTFGGSSWILFPELHPWSAKLHLTTTKHAWRSNGEKDCQPFADIKYYDVFERVFTDEEVLLGLLNAVGAAGAGCHVSKIGHVELRAAEDMRAVTFDVHCTVVNTTSTATSTVDIELDMAFPWSLIWYRKVYIESCSENNPSVTALKRGQESVRRISVHLPPPPEVLTDDVDGVGRWSYLISQSETLKEIPGRLDGRVFKRALELAKVSQMSFDEQTLYFNYKKDLYSARQFYLEEAAEREDAEQAEQTLKALRDAEPEAEQEEGRAERLERELPEPEAWRAEQEMWRGKQKAWEAEQELWRGKQKAWEGKQEALRGKQGEPSAEQKAWRAEQDAWRAEQGAWRAEQVAHRGEQVARRGEQETRRAEQEARRGERLARELAELKKKLNKA